VTYAFEGLTSKSEAVANGVTRMTFWPRVAGKLVVPSTFSLSVFDMSGAALPGVESSLTVNSDGSCTFLLTLVAAQYPAEDYFYDCAFVAPDGLTYYDRIYFDVCIVPLPCPIDTNSLVAIEPSIQKYMTAAGRTDAQEFVDMAWDELLQRIRGQGYRPALVTDRQAFVAPAIRLALEYAFQSCIREAGDKYQVSRDFWKEKAKEAWAALGRLKFEDTLQLGPAVGARTLAQPKFRI
jgi:hypothetical protein